jgi:outer membrane protein TolC
MRNYFFRRSRPCLALAAAISLSQQAGAETWRGKELSLADTIKAAIAASPRLKSARFREEALREEIRSQKSAYLPQLDVAVVASAGDPGSFAFLGVDNNFSASQRLGEGASLVLRQDLYDFGRTSSLVAVAEARQNAESKQRGIYKAEVAREVLRAYLDCSFLKAQVENARFIARQTALIARETGRFVRSGQRSIIERYLVDAELKESETRVAELGARATMTERRLAIEMGRPEAEAPSCEPLAAAESGIRDLERLHGPSPILEAQEAKIRAAQSRLENAKAETRPTIVGMATGGYWASERVPNDHMNYSLGVGITLPLFSGFRIESNIDREAADLHAEEALLAHSRLTLDTAGSRYDEDTSAIGVRLEFLKSEKALAKTAFDLARSRYLSFQGTMIDLRETIRNMRRILDATSVASRDLYVARGERALVVDGAQIAE